MQREVESLGLSQARLGGARLAPLRFRDASSPRPYVPLGGTTPQAPAGPRVRGRTLQRDILVGLLLVILLAATWWLQRDGVPQPPVDWGLPGSLPLLAVSPDSLSGRSRGEVRWQRDAAGALEGRGHGWLPVLQATPRFQLEGWLRDLGAAAFGVHLLRGDDVHFSLKMLNERRWVIAVVREDQSGERWVFPLHSGSFEQALAFRIEVDAQEVTVELGREQVYRERLTSDGLVPAIFVESDTGAAGFEELRVRFPLPADSSE